MTPEIQPTADGGEDVVVTDKELFDQAIAPEPTPSEPAKGQGPTEAPAQSQAGQSNALTPGQQAAAALGQRMRDAQGRFVPQQGARPPQADHRVPLREILDEREKRQRAEAEAQQLRNQWAALQQQAQALQQGQQPQQTIFDNPEQYLAERVINPILQMGELRLTQQKDGFSRQMARMQFGPQAEHYINTALADLAKIRYTPQGDVLYRQIMASEHPYGSLMQWHQQQQVQRAIGPNPQAWLAQQRANWVRDPLAQRQVIEHLRAQQQQRGRAGTPNVNLPPSLSSMPSAAGRLSGQGDLSDQSLYDFATKSK
jgi:hypothetical protein